MSGEKNHFHRGNLVKFIFSILVCVIWLVGCWFDWKIIWVLLYYHILYIFINGGRAAIVLSKYSNRFHMKIWLSRHIALVKLCVLIKPLAVITFVVLCASIVSLYSFLPRMAGFCSLFIYSSITIC